MHIKKIVPRVITYCLTPGNEDDCNFSHVNFVLDYDNRRLSINGDFGDFSYCWGKSQNDSLDGVLARCDKEYLLDKISARSKFLIKESKNAIIQSIVQNGYEEYGIKSLKEWKRIKQEILDIDESYSAEMYYLTVSNLIPSIDFESIEIIHDYPYRAYAVVDLFIAHIRPLMKAEISKQTVKRVEVDNPW